MTDFKKRVVSIYTEQTPNPENIKFVVNQMLYAHNSIDFPNVESVEGASEFAEELFKLPMVRNVFIANNFVTIGKTPDVEWIEVIPTIKNTIKAYLSEGKPVVDEKIVSARVAAEVAEIEQAAGDDAEMVTKIKEMLEKYVQPAVEMDGGSIVFKSYDDGIVTLGMQGACSGCPSSTITLKAGIEGMMKRMIPEVKEVVAEAM